MGTRKALWRKRNSSGGLVGARQAADMLGVTVRHVRRLAAARQLTTARKLGRDWSVDLAEVFSLMKEPTHHG